MTRSDGSIVRPRGPRRTLAAVLAGLALVVACSTPVPAIVLEVDPVAPELLRGGAVEVAVALTRLGGAADPVALAVTGLPADVASSFAPATLAGTTASSTLTLMATPATAEGTTTVTVTGTMGALTAEATFTLEVRSLSAEGRVLTVIGTPLPAIGVSSQGRAATSAADGSFRLDGLSLPYDLTLASAAGDGGMHVYEGLTTPTPSVVPQFAASPGPGTPTRSASLSGSVLGGAAVASGHVLVVCVEGLDVPVHGCDRRAAGDTAFALTATWFGAPVDAAVRVHALDFARDLDGLPTAYAGYASHDAALSDGVPRTLDLTFAPVPSTTMRGAFDVPAGLTFSAAYGYARFGPNLIMMLFQTPNLPTTYAVPMPALPGMSYDVVAAATGSPGASSLAWRSGAGEAAGTLRVPTPPALLAPAPGAVGVDGATVFTAIDAGVVRTFLWSPAVGGPQVALTTARTSVTIPDPAIVGLPFAPSAAADWTVFGLGVDHVDDAGTRGLMAYQAIASAPHAGGPGVDGDGSMTSSASQGFQFAP